MQSGFGSYGLMAQNAAPVILFFQKILLLFARVGKGESAEIIIKTVLSDLAKTCHDRGHTLLEAMPDVCGTDLKQKAEQA